jgi:hypothetical protein
LVSSVVVAPERTLEERSHVGAYFPRHAAPYPPEPIHFRPGLSLVRVAGSLGPLADLAGTWIGNGFVLISLPDFDPNPPSTGPKPFRLKLNTTVEILEFDQIGADVPNRGSTGQLDISIFGLSGPPGHHPPWQLAARAGQSRDGALGSRDQPRRLDAHRIHPFPAGIPGPV